VLPGVRVRFEILEYAPAPPPVAFAVVEVERAAPPEPPPPMTSMMFALLFQSAGTVHEEPDVRKIVTTVPVEAGPSSSASGAAPSG
jgi:hypothetical protein